MSAGGSGSRLALAALVALGVAIGIAGVELALRLTGPPREPGDFRGLHELRLDRPWLYRPRPGASGRPPREGGGYGQHYAINADGFRDRLYARARPPGSFRIVVIGDSVAFGYGVAEDETFPAVLERRLGELLPERHIEVLNMGVGGYNPYLEAAFLEDVGLAYEPDLVLVQFCINDLNDPTIHFDFHARQLLATIPDAAFPDPTRRRGASRGVSRLEAACMRLRICSRLYARLVAWREPEPGPRALREGLTPLGRTRGPEWRWLERHYRAMAEMARGAGAAFAVVAMPHRGQLAGSGPDPVQERLDELGERGGWPTLDPLPALRDDGESQREVFIDPWHPTRRGHRVAAEAILTGLACAGLLPAPGERLCADDAAPDAG